MGSCRQDGPCFVFETASQCSSDLPQTLCVAGESFEFLILLPLFPQEVRLPPQSLDSTPGLACIKLNPYVYPSCSWERIRKRPRVLFETDSVTAVHTQKTGVPGMQGTQLFHSLLTHKCSATGESIFTVYLLCLRVKPGLSPAADEALTLICYSPRASSSPFICGSSSPTTQCPFT